MRWTVMVEFGLCWPGFSGGLVPELRLGLIRLACTRGSVVDRLRGLLHSLADAAAELRAVKRPRIVPAPPPRQWDTEA